MKKLSQKLPVITALVFSLGINQAHAGPITYTQTISTTTNSSVNLANDDDSLLIDTNGLIQYDTSVLSSPGIFGSGENLTIHIETTTDEGGVVLTGSPSASVQITGSLTSLDLVKGQITSETTPSLGAVTLTSGVDSTSVINLSEGTKIANSADGGYGILSYSNSDINLTINNSGTIQASSNEDSVAIAMEARNPAGSSTIIINNLGNGTINSGADGYAIYLNSSGITAEVHNDDFGAASIIGGIYSGENELTLSNKHSNSITGDIDATSGKLIITNTDDATINGDIYLGTNALSSLTLKGGTVTGNVIMDNAGQSVSFSGGTLIGDLDGAGSVFVAGDNQTHGNIGYNSPVSLIQLSSSAKLTVDNDEIHATDIKLKASSTLELKGGSVVHAAINGLSASSGSITTESLVVVRGEIGSTTQISSIDVQSGSQGRFGSSNVTSANTIRADEISIHGTMVLDSATTIDGNVTMYGSASQLGASDNSHTINGNFTTASGSQLFLRLHSPTEADQITVSGLLMLDANTKLNLTINNEGDVRGGSTYTLLSGGTGSTLNAISTANLSINGLNTDMFGILKFSTEVDGNNLLLHVVSTYQNLNNPNSQAAYGAIMGATSATGGLATLQTFLESGASTSSSREAAKSAAAQVDNSTNRVAFNNIDTIGSLISNRLDSVRSGVASGEGVKNKAMWMQFMGASVKQGNTSSTDGYDAKSSGFAFGFDKEVKDDLILGVSGAYSHTNVDGRNSSKDLFIDSYQLSAYSGYTKNNLFLNAVIGAAFNEYKSSRYISLAGAEARANYSGQSYSARAEMGYNFITANQIILTPILTLTAARNAVDSYDETGAGTLNLYVRNDSSNFFEGRIGGQVKKFFKTKSGAKFAPQFNVSYGYDFAGNKQKATANFIGQNLNFANSGARIAQGSLKIGTGVDFYTLADTTISANYIYENRNQYSAHSGWLKARYAF